MRTKGVWAMPTTSVETTTTLAEAESHRCEVRRRAGFDGVAIRFCHEITSIAAGTDPLPLASNRHERGVQISATQRHVDDVVRAAAVDPDADAVATLQYIDARLARVLAGSSLPESAAA